MSQASLALAVALGSLPLGLILFKATPPPAPALAPQEPSLGDCRPDIGPGGIIQVHPDTSSPNYQATLITTPLPTGNFFYVANSTQKVKLNDWEKYTLKVDYSTNPPTAQLLDKDGNPVLAGFPTVQIYSRLDTDPLNPDTAFSFGPMSPPLVFDKAYLLQVYHKVRAVDPALAAYYMTTISVIEAP